MSLLTTKQLAQKLGVTIGTIYRMVKSNLIPVVRIGMGRRLRFDFEEVKSALMKPTPPALTHRRKKEEDPLLRLHELAIETGIKDLAQNHDHYLYGVPIKPALGLSKR